MDGNLKLPHDRDPSSGEEDTEPPPKRVNNRDPPNSSADNNSAPLPTAELITSDEQNTLPLPKDTKNDSNDPNPTTDTYPAPLQIAERVSAANLHSILALPIDVHFEILDRLPQQDLINCLTALPTHSDVIGHVIGRRLIRIDLGAQRYDQFPFVCILAPYLTRLLVDFNNDNSDLAINRQKLLFVILANCNRLDYLELRNYTASSYGPLGPIGIRSICITNADVSDDHVVSYVLRDQPAEQVESLRLSNVDGATGAFLRAMYPNLQKLHMQNKYPCSTPFVKQHLLDYVKRCETLRTLQFETSNPELEALDISGMYEKLKMVEEVRVRHHYPPAYGIQHVKTAAVVAQMPNLLHADLQMTAPALCEFLDRLPYNSRLKSLYVKLSMLNGEARVLQLCANTAAERMHQLTTLCIKLPTYNDRMPVATEFTAELEPLLEQLSLLPAFTTLTITHVNPLNAHNTSAVYDKLPHDLSGHMLMRYLPRLKHLRIELPSRYLNHMGQMKQLVSLHVIIMRTTLSMSTRQLRRREEMEVNWLLQMLCSFEHLRDLSILGSSVPLWGRTCLLFAKSAMHKLEMTLLQDQRKVMLLLKYAKYLRTYIDRGCDMTVWISQKDLAKRFPHIYKWDLYPNLDKYRKVNNGIKTGFRRFEMLINY